MGRERQLAALQELVAEAASGRGQVVGVVAEPGMGKSRIVAELRRSLAAERLTVLEGRCLSYGSAVPYVPLADIVRANCGIADGDSPAEVEAKVAFGLAELGIDPGPRVPLLLQMMGAPRRRGGRRPQPGGDQAAHVRDPVDDVHHRQPPPAAAPGGRGPPLGRPRVRGVPRPARGEHPGRPARPRLHLPARLPGPVDAGVLRDPARPAAADPRREPRRAARRARRARGAPDVLEEVVERADGNPFFLEELARALLERRAHRRGASPCPEPCTTCCWRASTGWRRSRGACSRPPPCWGASSRCGCSRPSGAARAGSSPTSRS